MTALGQLELEEVIGRGGMATVWRAIRAVDNRPVAVKILTSRRTAESHFVEGFYNEVRAVARLDHPGIVQILDLGTVSEEESGQLELDAMPGSPYYVMEYIAGGTLSPLSGRLRWSRLRATLLELLEALAHAHARGIIHRDLKPSNVLLLKQGHDVQPKIADFGIARSADVDIRKTAESVLMGTPSYMAPEQITHGFFGPWTDLYALGCIAFKLATGAPPFSHDDKYDTFDAQVSEPPPPLVSRMKVHPEFESWVLRLLQKNPYDRFTHAADAAEALSALPENLGEEGEFAEAVTDEIPLVGKSRPMATVLAQAPKDWRIPGRFDDHEASPLRLVGLRPPPMLGRRIERDELWGLLAKVQQSRRPHAMILRGPEGCGKTHLTEWFVHRAAESGAATVLRAAHSDVAGSKHGLETMFARHFDARGVGEAALVERIRDWHGRHGDVGAMEIFDSATLAEMISAGVPGTKTTRAFASPMERFVVMGRVLTRMSTERPVIVWLDDVHRSVASTEFARFLLEQDEEAPLVIIATMDSGYDPQANPSVQHLIAHPGSQLGDLLPLKPEDLRELLNSVARLETSVVDSVVDRTEGNPLFALQLLQGWVERGMLQRTPTGFFHLEEGTDPELPADLGAVVADRLQQIVGDDEAVWQGLEIAAALGADVDASEWEAVCAACGVAIRRYALAQVFQAGVLVAADSGWSFGHSPIRQYLVERAQTGKRWKRINRQCAALVATRKGLDALHDLERYTHHIVAAGDIKDAIKPLFEATARALEFGDTPRAKVLLEEYERALDDIRTPPHHQRRIAAAIQRGAIALQQGDAGTARAIARAAAERARDINNPRLIGDALQLAGNAHRSTSVETAVSSYQEACRHYGACGHEHGLARAHMSLAWVKAKSSRGEEALADAETAIILFEDLDSPVWEARARQVYGHVLSQLGRFDDAKEALERAVKLDSRIGNNDGLAHTRVELGELERAQGRPKAAAKHYRKAAELFHSTGSSMVLVAEMYLGFVALARDDMAGAASCFDAMRPHEDELVERGVWPQSLLGIACVSAWRGDWDACRGSLAAAERYIDQVRVLSRDIASAALRTGDLASEAGVTEIAMGAWTLAENQFHGLGAENEARELRGKLLSR